MNCISSEWEEMIYRDLARGIYCPDEAEAEAFGPLPPEEHTGAEYTTLEVQELLTGIEENVKSTFQQGETLNRFSAAYADLCPRMMDLLRLAACALSTLYVNGEDVNAAAVSILDLRRLGSFHYRKCHAAARAALGRNETIWVRTSALELQWAKLLLRLQQTEVRFSRPLPQPKTAPAVVPHSSVKLPESESVSASAPEPVRTLPRTAAIPAASPFRAPRPASQSAAFQPEQSPLQIPAANDSAEVRREVLPADETPETPMNDGSAKSQPESKANAEPLPELPQADESRKPPRPGTPRINSAANDSADVRREVPETPQNGGSVNSQSGSETNEGPQPELPPAPEPREVSRKDKSRKLPRPGTPRINSLDLDEEDLRLLKEFSDLQSYRESRGLSFSRDIRLSDLFVPYDPEDSPPEDS